MKKAFLVLLFVTPALLFANLNERDSNSIGQDLGPVQGNAPYHLSVDGNVQTLFGPQGMVQRIESSGSVVEKTDGGGNVVSKQFFESGRLVKEEDGGFTYLYVYSGEGKLDRMVTLHDDLMVQMDLYSYEHTTGSLAAILAITQDESSIRYFGRNEGFSWFSYSKGAYVQRFDEVAGGVSLRQSWDGDQELETYQSKFLDNGNLLITRFQGESKTEEQYDPHGLLVLSKTPLVLTEYRYNESGVLFEVQVTNEGGTSRTTQFKEGREVMAELYDEHSTLYKTITYGEDKARTETLYSDGKPYCDVTFASDGKRVVSISYR